MTSGFLNAHWVRFLFVLVVMEGNVVLFDLRVTPFHNSDVNDQF